MQLTSLVPPVPVTPAAATQPAAQPVAAPASAAAAVVDDAQPGLRAKLLGGVAEARLGAASAQQRSLERQQLLGAISAGLGARFSQIAHGVWSMLRGIEQPTDPQAAAG